MSNKSSKDLAKTYQKKTDREHILDAPDTYIGSIDKDPITNWIFKDDQLKYETFDLVAGLYKCFDEGIVNARDHYIRMKGLKDEDKECKQVSYIHVDIDPKEGMISITNDGDGIDIAKHPEHDIWIPEMIFGHLRTSTNYNKDEKRVVGGKNGFGFKLVLIYSTWGKIETIDHRRGLKYVQEFRDNLSVIEKAKVTKCKSKKTYTKVSWIPDYKRFSLNGLTDEMFRLFKKRTYDIAAMTDKGVKVKFNGDLIPVKSFEQYVNMYVGSKTETTRIYEQANERWEYALCLTPFDEFAQVSFVNGIYTSKGGKHIDYILNQICKKLVEYIEKKKKIKVKIASIKEQIMLFVNCVIENPSFDSQTKDTLNTPSSKFGSSCKVSDKFIEKLAKLGVMEQAISIHELKENKDSKKTDGKKTRTIYGIPKLIDANFAGTAKSQECILILCEGDSAKAGIVSGLSKEDRNIMGVYPLRGKLMNVRDATITKINDNNEIKDIKKIMGLEANKKYKDTKTLRYGKIWFMTDQDLDGVHIKGLIINVFDSQWNDLIKINNFLGFMNTPILKARNKKKEVLFYNEKEYKQWKKDNDMKGWNIKYYKGLGTSTSSEFKEYFKNRKTVDFIYDKKTSSDALDKVFRKHRACDRKDWLENYDRNNTLDTSKSTITYEDFVDKEMIHFSKYDCERSIPNIMDGLKTSQRKILYCAFKRNLTSEIKVAQFGGYVSEHSGYHHGETSLMQAIVGMAQDFVGSNNINLLLPNGQFGTRMQGGADSASERYIFTQLNPITRHLFPASDDPIIDYNFDDGVRVEPEFFVPIIPMILVNGALGIGTGFSTQVLCYNPIDIVKLLICKLRVFTGLVYNDVYFPSTNEYAEKYGEVDVSTIPLYEDEEQPVNFDIVPYYRDFKGEVVRLNKDTYIIRGVYEIEKHNIIHITELPLGVWTDTYKQYLEKYIPTKIKEYNDMSTDKKVDIRITFVKGEIQNMLKKINDIGCTELEKMLHLFVTKKTSNMHLFDQEQRLKKFNSPEEIIEHFIPVRMKYYLLRKQFMLHNIKRKLVLLSNKAQFIQQQCNDEIDLRRMKRDDVIKLLQELEYDTIDDDETYTYLRSMPIDSVTEEKIEELMKERDDMIEQLNIMENTTEKELWEVELIDFMSKYKNIKI